MKLQIFLFYSALLLLASCNPGQLSITSPDGRITLQTGAGGEVPFSYVVLKDGEVLVKNSAIELDFRDQESFSGDIHLQLLSQTSVDETKSKAKNPGHIESATEAVSPLFEGVSGSNDTETKAADGYIKIGDIKGESTRAADTISPDRIEFKKAIAAPDLDTDSDEDDSDNATDYNSSRSNKADSIAAPDPDENDNDDGDDKTDQKATDYNSSRSNKNSKH